jgi:hypothetical protein
MPQLTIRVFATDAATGAEMELARLDSSEFSPDHLDVLVQRCLKQALADKGQPLSGSTKQARLEVSAYLSADEHEGVRPALHLSLETIRQLADAYAEFDFDPYV